MRKKINQHNTFSYDNFKYCMIIKILSFKLIRCLNLYNMYHNDINNEDNFLWDINGKTDIELSNDFTNQVKNND